MPKLESLINQLASGDDAKAEQAAVLLPDYGEAAFQATKKLLNQPDEESQWWAIRALSEFETPAAIEILIENLANDFEAVQQCAALGLSQCPHPNAIPHLIPLLNHKTGILPRLAGNALIKTGEAATQALLNILETESASQHARLEATRALGMIGDPKAISALFKLIDNDSALLEYWANEGLDKMGIGMTFFNPK